MSIAGKMENDLSSVEANDDSVVPVVKDNGINPDELVTTGVNVHVNRIPTLDTEQNEIIVNLLKMDKKDPRKREPDKYDIWFKEHVEEFCEYGKAMMLLECFGHLGDSFIANLKNPEKNLQLQKMLVSVSLEHYWVNFSNLLCKYTERWDLLPEIKQIIFNDKRFKDAEHIYELYRNPDGTRKHRR